MVYPSSTRLQKPNFLVTITQSKREVHKNIGNDFHAKGELNFSNSLIIHEEKTKEITTVKEVGICDPNYHKIQRTFALIFSKNYQCFEKLYQTRGRVFHQISKHFEVG